MNAKIWRVLAQILCNRKGLAKTLKPFFENLNNHSIHEDPYIPLLKTFSKYQLAVLYKNGIVTEEKENQLLPNNQNTNQLSSKIPHNKGNESKNKNIIEEIISGDKLEELHVFIKEHDINAINTIITSFNEVEEMIIPIIQFCVIKKAWKCFKYLLVNGYDNPTKEMEEQKPNSNDLFWENQHRYEWDCMATAIYLGEIEMVTILEEKGMKIGKNTVHLEAAILSYRNEIVKEIIDQMIRNEENNQKCLSKGILASSKNNNIKGAELLIQKGANIKVTDFQSNSIQKKGLPFILQQRIIQKR